MRSLPLSPRLIFSFLPFFAVLVLAGSVSAQEQYLLEVPGRNDLTSTASVSPQELVITDAQNRTFRYQREPQWDSRDGQYWGFYSRAANQALRWPVNGTGAMLIADPNGQNWRRSQQQVQLLQANPAARRNLPRDAQGVTARRPAFNGRGQGPQAGFPQQDPRIGLQQQQFQQQQPLPQQRQFQQQQFQQQQQQGAGNNYPGPMQVAYAPAGERALDVGMIDQSGDLQLYRGWRDDWEPYNIPRRSDQRNSSLIPGAPLALVSQRGQQVPTAYTVGSEGRLLEIANGNQIRPVADNLQLAPRSHLHLQPDRRGFVVDQQGRLWQLDLAGGQHQLIDQRADQLSPGVPISVVSHPQRQNQPTELFLVDRAGQVVNYSLGNGRWNGPQSVAAGFPPGAPLAAVMHNQGGAAQMRLAGVDALGRVQMLAQSRGRWQAVPVRGAQLPPGSPLAFTQVEDTLSLAGIGAGGAWNNWTYTGGGWNEATVSQGFLAGAPVVGDPWSQTAFGVDATGRLVAGGYWDDAWHPYLLMPGLDYAPPLVERRITDNRRLGPATVYFDNPSQEELVVQMVEPLNLGAPQQFTIPPGGSVPQRVRRDGGGTLQEVYLVPDGFGGWIESVDSFPLPPQPGPTAVVWSKQVTYRYVDPKNISVLPDFDIKNNVSLGVFELPPGEFLNDGDRFDVYREAASRFNPGAAQWFGPPAPDPDVGVRLYRGDNRNLPARGQNYQQPSRQQIPQGYQQPSRQQTPQDYQQPSRQPYQNQPSPSTPRQPTPQDDSPRGDDRVVPPLPQ